MLFEQVITLISVFFISSVTETAELARCSDWKSKVPLYLKNSKDKNSNIKYRSELKNLPLSSFGLNRYRIAKRDDISKDNEDWSEAFNMFDWWKNLRPNRKQSTKQKPVSNSVKRVCFDELLNAQLSNKSYLSLIHFKPRLSEPYGYFEAVNSPWSTAKLTEVQMDNSVKSVINATEGAKEIEVTSISAYASEQYETSTDKPSCRASTTLEGLRNMDYRKGKNKTEKPEKIKTDKNEKAKPEKSDKDKNEKVKTDKDKEEKSEKDKNDKSEKSSNRLILTLNENKSPSDSKNMKPFGNFSVEYVENAGRAPSSDSSTVRIVIKTGDKDYSKGGGKKKPGFSIENPASDQFPVANDQEINLRVDEDEPFIPDEPKENKTRKIRSLYPNPTDSRQFHLMHGLYSGNGAQMEDALRQAEIQALNVASDLQRSSRLRQANAYEMFGPSGLRTQQEQIMPEMPRDMSIDEEVLNERNRHSKRKTNLLPNDPYVMFDSQLQERMKFLNDLNSAISKKKEELGVLERTFKNEQSFASPVENCVQESKIMNPNIYPNSPELTEQLTRPFQLSNVGERLEKTNLNHEQSSKLNSNTPIMSNNMNLNESLVNNPYLESILRAYANNFLNPLLNQQNLTSPEFHKRSKRDVTNVEIERPPTFKKRRCRHYLTPNIEKENLLNSLKELEELERILMKEYEKDFGSITDKKPDKRWLLSGRDARTISPYVGQFDETYLTAPKCDSPEVIHPDLLFGKKKPNKTISTDYSKKFSVLENDLIDLKNAISNINTDQNKMDKSDNDTNNIFVQVNVSVALFNGSSTPPGCENVCKRDSDSLKGPIATLVTVNKLNVTDAPGQNKKTQGEKSKILLRVFDRKRDLAKLNDQVKICSSDNWPNRWKSSTQSYKFDYKSKSMNRTQAILNLNEQFEAIEKTLTDDTNCIRDAQKLSKINAVPKVTNNFQKHYINHDQLWRCDIKPLNTMYNEAIWNQSSRSKEVNHLVSRRYPNRNVVNFFARKELDQSNENGKLKSNDIIKKPKHPLKMKAKPCQTKSSQPYIKSFQKLGSTEPTLYIREDNSAQILKEMLQNENTKPEIKNFTIILNRKRKDCQNLTEKEDDLELGMFEKYGPHCILSNSLLYNCSLGDKNKEIFDIRTPRDTFELPKNSYLKNYGNECLKYDADQKVVNEDTQWDLINDCRKNDAISNFAEEADSIAYDNNILKLYSVTERNNATQYPDFLFAKSEGCNSTTNEFKLNPFSHKCDKRSTGENFAYDENNTDVITDLVIPLHFVHFSDNDKNLSWTAELKNEFNVKPRYSITYNSDNLMFNNSDSYLCKMNDKQVKENHITNENDSSNTLKQRQVRNTITLSNYEYGPIPDEKKHMSEGNKKVLIDFSTNLNDDGFNYMPSKPPEDLDEVVEEPKKSIKTKKLIVDLDGIDYEPITTCKTEVYDIIHIQKQVFFRLSTPPCYYDNLKQKKSPEQQKFDNKTYFYSINKAIVDIPNTNIVDTTRSYSDDSFDFAITSKYKKSTEKKEENIEKEEKMQRYLNYIIQRNNMSKKIYNQLRKATNYAKRPVGRRKSFISSSNFQPLLKKDRLMSLNHQVRRRPPEWFKKKQTQDFLKKLDEEMLYDDMLTIEESDDDNEYFSDPGHYVDKDRNEYIAPTPNENSDQVEAIYNGDDIEEETPIEWFDANIERIEKQNSYTYNPSEFTIPMIHHQQPKLRFPCSNLKLVEPYGEELDEQSNDIYKTTTVKYSLTDEEISSMSQLSKFGVSSTTESGYVTKRATIHPSHVQKQHKKFSNNEKYMYKTYVTRPTLLPKYKIDTPATDLIYFNKFSLKIGERTTMETTEPVEGTEELLKSDQIHQVRKFSKKFRNSASKVRKTLKKEKQNRFRKNQLNRERKLRGRHKSGEEENDEISDETINEQLYKKRNKLRRKPTNNND